METPATDRAADAPAPPGTWARAWRWTRIALALALLAGLVWVARPEQLWRQLCAARYLWTLAALPFAFAGTMADAVRLYWLMRPVGWRGGFGSVAKTNLVVNAVSIFLPGTIGGGAVAWFRLSAPDGLRAQTAVALSLNAVLKFTAVCGVSAAALALDAGAAGESRGWVAPLALMAALPLAALMAMLYTPLATRLREFHSARLARRMPARLHEVGRKLLESFERYRAAPGATLAALGAGVCRLALVNVASLFCVWAVGIDMPYLRVLWITGAMEVAGMMPFTLAGWGLPQVTYVGLMGLCGVAADQALASHVLSWVACMPIYLAGAGALMAESVRKPTTPS
jgi:uncharacterized membrane protein YbhN (UPF0104 family)